MLDRDNNYIVSGLERSGTSLMMQMLHNGGLPVAYDESRIADEHNPRGYYELAGGKIINRLMNADFNLEAYRGQIIKVTAYGLKFLPPAKYKIIYMMRNIDEVLKSMKKMGADIKEEDDRTLFSKLDSFSIELMLRRSDMDHIKIHYRDLLNSARREMDRVAQSWNVQFDIEAALKSVDTGLYRNRAI